MIKIDDVTLLSGQPIFSKELGIEIRQPVMKEIALFGIDNWNLSLEVLLLNRNEINALGIKDSDKYSEFYWIYQILQASKDDSYLYDEKMISFFNLILPQYKVLFHQNNKIQIAILQDEKLISVLDEENYDIFKDYLKKLFIKESNEQEYNIDEKDPLAQSIKKKLEDRKVRLQKVGDKKWKHNPMANMISTMSIGTGLSINNIYELTLYQFYELFSRMIKKMSFDQAVSATMAGASGIKIEGWYEDV